MIRHEDLMGVAIEEARRSLDEGQYPFGCAIAFDGQVFVDHNRIRELRDVTAHAEIVTLRRASRETGEVYLSGAVVATTSEPCVMCAGALHWARVGTLLFGASVDDVRSISGRELPFSVGDFLRDAGSDVVVCPAFQREECLALFDQWHRMRAERRQE